MTREDIIRMAREAEMSPPTELAYNNYWTAYQSELERFAALVAAAEREACAKVCDDLNFVDNGTPAGTRASNRHCAAAIRARGNT